MPCLRACRPSVLCSAPWGSETCPSLGTPLGPSWLPWPGGRGGVAPFEGRVASASGLSHRLSGPQRDGGAKEEEKRAGVSRLEGGGMCGGMRQGGVKGPGRLGFWGSELSSGGWWYTGDAQKGPQDFQWELFRSPSS